MAQYRRERARRYKKAFRDDPERSKLFLDEVGVLIPEHQHKLGILAWHGVAILSTLVWSWAQR